MYRCGLLGWAILDGEEGVFTVRWSLLGLFLSGAAALAGGAAAWAVQRRLSGNRVA